ncbi:hypothetical protein BDR04DRAFT_1129300 [Suillus decipiens]|nr:hypothetical protein BDR04DRAFT_1129300 [Suillus decipiens]
MGEDNIQGNDEIIKKENGCTTIVTAALTGILILDAEEAHLMKNCLQNPPWLYLCHPQLLLNPCIITPWMQLYESYNDHAYITMMRFDVTTFHQLLNSGFANKNSTTIPLADVSSQGQPCIGPHSLDAAEISLQQIFALIPTTVNCYLNFALDIFLQTLHDMPEDNFPICAHHPRLVGGFASIDGLSLPCQEADDPEVKNATYNGWKSSHFISNVSIIISAILNAPGSWHNSHTSHPVYAQLHQKTPDGYYLIADSVFLHGISAISGKIQAPLKSDAILQAKWGMQMMQGSFGRLHVPLDVNDQLCVRLSNVRAICVGINQIHSVYMPIWKAWEDEQLWLDLSNVLFGDIHHCDCVACYHLVGQTQ